MAPLHVVVVIACLCTVATGQFLNCNWVNSLDCMNYGQQGLCGTDGVSYPNRCYFAKQQCMNGDLHILHDGACLSSELSTTMLPPGPTVDGETAILDFFCTQLSHRDCDDADQPVCASDGWTYKNYCEYDKARCTHRDMHVVNFGQCVE